jgi:hypothetical protein
MDGVYSTIFLEDGEQGMVLFPPGLPSTYPLVGPLSNWKKTLITRYIYDIFFGN